MTREEIKKALETCADGFHCEACPYDDNFAKCVVRLKEDACSLIIEQEKEIEKLKSENARLTTKLGQVLLSIDTVKEMNAMCNIDAQRKQAVQDFVEKLKEECCKVKGYEYSFANIAYLINQLLKEYE